VRLAGLELLQKAKETLEGLWQSEDGAADAAPNSRRSSGGALGKTVSDFLAPAKFAGGAPGLLGLAAEAEEEEEDVHDETIIAPECRDAEVRHSAEAQALAAQLSLSVDTVSYARHIGVDAADERSLLWVAEALEWAVSNGLNPPSWQMKRAPEGTIFYENEQLGFRCHDNPHSSALSCLVRLLRVDGYAAPFDLAWTPAQVAQEVVRRLTAKGLADASHPQRLAERQRALAARFAEVDLCGAKLATLDARSLEVELRAALEGDAKQDDLLAVMLTMLPRVARSVDTGHRAWQGTLNSDDFREVQEKVRERARAQAGSGSESGSGVSPPMHPTAAWAPRREQSTSSLSDSSLSGAVGGGGGGGSKKKGRRRNRQ